jgi:hypothetical protein
MSVDGILWTALFSPSKNWDKIPGYQIGRLALFGTSAAEPLNLAVIAQEVGFSRDVIESGIKDLVNALTLILRQGSIVHLVMGKVGKLVFNNLEVKFIFSPCFTDLLNAEKRTVLPPMATKNMLMTEIPVPQLMSGTAFPVDYAGTYQQEMAAVLRDEQEINNTSKKITKHYPGESLVALIDLETATEKLVHLEKLIGETFGAEASNVSSHTHFHSGNRLWSDKNCPICKSIAKNNYVDGGLIKKTEKENDKMLLQISLEIDQQYLDKKKEREQMKLSDSLETAQYNRIVGIQQKEKIQFNRKEPMGDVFEKRKVQIPVLSSIEMARGIQDQIKMRQRKIIKAEQENSFQEKLISEALRKE